MKKKVITEYLLFVCLFLLVGITTTAYAGSASVLPKGISAVGLDGQFYMPIKKRFNPEGKAEDLAIDYNTELNSGVFVSLAAFGAGANLGISTVSFEYDIKTYNLGYQYGITDKLTAGIRMPYWSAKNKVDISLDTTGATIGKIAGAPYFWPIAGGGTPLTAEDVLDLIGDGLDTNDDGTIDIDGFGLGFGTWSGSGMGDIELSAKYQFFNSDDWKLAFTGGVSIPTAEVDDPDSLTDIPPGSGAYALLFRSYNDYTRIENLVLNATMMYNMVLPDKRTLRVPSDPNLPITTAKAEVSRDIGDVFKLEGSAVYKLSRNFGVSAQYSYGEKFRDKISESQYDALEKETTQSEHVYVIGMTYDTISRFKAKEFPIPLMASLSYRDRFAGSGNVLKSQYISLSITSFF